MRYRAGGAERHGSGRRRGAPRRRRRSTRRSCSSCPGIGDPDVLARTRHRGAPRARRASARTCRITCRSAPSSASPAPAPSTSSPTAASARLTMAARICALPTRAAVDGAEPARHLLAQRRDRGDARSRVPRPAAQHRQARRPAPPLPGGHRVGLQSPAREPRHHATSGAAIRPSSRRSASTTSAPSATATSPSRRSARRAASPAPRRSAATRPRRLLPGPAVTARRRSARRHRQHRHHDLPSRRHLPDGQPTTAPWSTTDLRVHGLDRPARRRRLDHADDHLGQHRLAGGDDRREGFGPDPKSAPTSVSQQYARREVRPSNSAGSAHVGYTAVSQRTTVLACHLSISGRRNEGLLS